MSYYPFLSDDGSTYGSCEVFFMSAADIRAHWRIPGWDGFAVPSDCPGDPRDCCADNPSDLQGWYWQACQPGCLPDGDPMGPFPSESDAIADANCAA